MSHKSVDDGLVSWALLRFVRTSTRPTSVQDLELEILRDDEALRDVLVLSLVLYPTLMSPFCVASV